MDHVVGAPDDPVGGGYIISQPALDAGWKLGSHGLPAVQPAAIRDERAVADRMEGAEFLPAGGNVRGDGFQHDDVVPPDDVDDLALDVRQAFLDQRRPDDLGRKGRQMEPGEFIDVRARARADANNFIQQVRTGNGEDALAGFGEGPERMVPCAGGDGEPRREIHHHGPGEGHDVVFAAIEGGHQHDRSRLDQREGLAQLQRAHGCLLFGFVASVQRKNGPLGREDQRRNRPGRGRPGSKQP